MVSFLFSLVGSCVTTGRPVAGRIFWKAEPLMWFNYAANTSRLLARASLDGDPTLRRNLGANGGSMWPHHPARQDTLRRCRVHFRRKWAWRRAFVTRFLAAERKAEPGPDCRSEPAGQSPVAAGLSARAFSGPLAMASAGPRKSPGEVSRAAGLDGRRVHGALTHTREVLLEICRCKQSHKLEEAFANQLPRARAISPSRSKC